MHVQHKFLNHFAAFVVAAAAAATATATATDLPSAVQAVVQVTKLQAMCARFNSRSGPDTARRVAGVASSMPLTEQYQTEHNVQVACGTSQHGVALQRTKHMLRHSCECLCTCGLVLKVQQEQQ